MTTAICAVAVNGCAVAVNGCGVAVNGCAVAVNGCAVAVNGCADAVNGCADAVLEIRNNNNIGVSLIVPLMGQAASAQSWLVQRSDLTI